MINSPSNPVVKFPVLNNIVFNIYLEYFAIFLFSFKTRPSFTVVNALEILLRGQSCIPKNRVV